MKKYSELKDLELISEAALESSLAGFWDWNMATNEEYLSPRFKEMFGYLDHEMENSPEAWQKIAFQEDLPKMFEAFQKHIDSKGEIPFHTVIRYHHKKGHTVWIRCNGKIVNWSEEGIPLRAVGCHIDITEDKELEFELKKAIDEKTVLLKEVHHRVKNNLQLIQSLARLKQKDNLVEINEIEDSISAIANAHEAIYRAERFDEIDLGKYLHRVISPLLICESIAFEIESFNVKEKINYLVQIGLILSECANNSLKHAFKEDFPNKKISVSLEKNKNKLKITYKDNGKGYPETVLKEQETQDSFGLSLINSLAQQVNGKVTLSNNKGAQSELEIITETN